LEGSVFILILTELEFEGGGFILILKGLEEEEIVYVLFVLVNL
jgi:hypothetical protein